MDGQCQSIAEHERLFGKLLSGQEHLEEKQKEISERLERVEHLIYWLGWVAAVTLGGVALQLFLLLVGLKK